MSENMTVCPECGVAFETVAEVEETPRQALQQECPECDYTVQVSILNYADGKFTVIAPALVGDTCDGQVAREDEHGTTACGNGAMIRMQKVGRGIEGRCAEHMGAHRETALEMRDEL